MGRHGKSKSRLGVWVAVAAAAWIFWPRKPGTGSDPVPPLRLAPPAPSSPAVVGPMRFDWPRGAAPEGKAELAADLAMRNFYVVLDGSGSMAEQGCSGNLNKMDAAKQALAEFAKSVPANAQLGLAAFDNRGVSERVPLGLGNRDRFLEAVRGVQASGGTPLRSGIALGIEKLESAARRQLGYGEYNLVVVTDGEASSGEDPSGVVAEVLGRSPVTVHTIGFCIGSNHSLNQPGRTVYRTADNPAELRAGLGDVLAESATFDVTGFAAGGAGRE